MERYRVKVKGILKRNDEFLIIRKWLDDRIDEPYQWSFFDTALEGEDTPEATALRYIYDSTGLDADIVSVPYTWTYTLGDNRYLGIAVLCTTDEDVIVLSEECCGYKWVKEEELPEYIEFQGIIDDLTRTGVIH